MNRINGYIDLDEMKRNEEISVNSRNDINSLESFTYNENIYFFKPEPFNLAYNELVAEELLKDFGLPCASYDLAILDGEEGNITKNYRKDNAKYINGQVLLETYIDFLEDTYYEDCMNNLTDIWNALEFRYEKNLKKEEIVYKLMDKIVNLFIFDIMTEHSDRHECNFEIEESDNNIDLAPIYDNERIIYGSGYTSISVDRDTISNDIEELKKFLDYSDYSYIDRIKDRLWIIDRENLEKVFKRIEDKTQYPISEDIKERFISKFQMRKNELETILDNYTRKAI